MRGRENDLTPGKLESKPTGSSRAGAADFFLKPPNLTPSNFEVLYSTDSLFIALKDLSLLKKYIKNQKASIISKIVFDLSK